MDGVWKEFDGNDDRNACCSGDLLEVTTVQFIEDAISISNPEILSDDVSPPRSSNNENVERSRVATSNKAVLSERGGNRMLVCGQDVVGKFRMDPL